jgi:hypothetical protein
MAAAAVALAATLLAAGAGWIVRGLTESSPGALAPPPVQVAHAGAAAVSVPAGWRPVAQVPGVAGLPGAAGFQPVRALSAYALVALASRADATLVPATLRATLPAKLPAPRPATLGGAPAWHYDETTMDDGRQIELTVAPTTRGVLAVACIASRDEWIAAAGCADQMRSAALDDGAWLEPGPEVAVRALIPGVIARLDARRIAIRTRLQAATSSRWQRRLVGHLADAYAQAAAALAPATPPVGAPAGVLAAVRDAAAANRRLAGAAGAGGRAGYSAARRDVARRDQALDAALAALR